VADTASSHSPSPQALGVQARNRVWILNLGLIVGALLLGLLAAQLEPPVPGPRIPLVLLAAGFGVAEVFVIHVRLRQDAHSFSLSEIPLVIGLALCSPVGMVTAQVVGVGIALRVHRRQNFRRVAFNMAQRAFTALVAVFVFQSMTRALGSEWPAIWAGAFAATLTADVLSGLLINVAIALSQNEPVSFDEIVGPGSGLTAASTSVGLISVMLLAEHPASIVLVLIPAATTFLAASAYSALHRKHETVIALYEATRLAQQSLDLHALIPELLKQAQAMFQAEVAEVLLFPGEEGGPALRSVVDRERAEVLEPVTLDPLEGVWARVASEGEGILLARPIANDRLAEHFTRRGIRDALVVPLTAGQAMLGTMLVANRVGDFSTFNAEELQLLETLANHVAVAVRNARLVHRLEASLAHETEMNELKDDFVATISHELRTPLTSIQGYIKTLLWGPVELSAPEQHEFLQIVEHQSERLRALIEDLLFASRIEASRWVPTSMTVSLPEIAQRVIESQAGSVDPRRFVLQFEPAQLSAHTSEEHVLRILGNLVSNAVKYSEHDQPIVITGRAAEDGLVLSVIDRGCGIPPEERERIFERFYQIDQSATRRVGGAGIGLYICRQAAELLGGRVWVERSDPDGSTFSLWLPSIPSEAVSGNTPASTAHIPAVGVPSGSAQLPGAAWQAASLHT
jgi:signal transduction histidine kinase